jgi:hypothetical protein
MTERIIDKLDRLGAEAEIKEMTPEIRRFALLVRQDVVAGWPNTARPTVPDALTIADKNSADYHEGWNDCRALMLEMRKP